jgi:hypothetical protein
MTEVQLRKQIAKLRRDVTALEARSALAQPRQARVTSPAVSRSALREERSAELDEDRALDEVFGLGRDQAMGARRLGTKTVFGLLQNRPVPRGLVPVTERPVNASAAELDDAEMDARMGIFRGPAVQRSADRTRTTFSALAEQPGRAAHATRERNER